MTSEEVCSIIANSLQFLDFNNSTKLIIADNNYLPVDYAWIHNAIISDPVISPQRYKNDIFDCDDYVLYLKTKISLFAQSNALQSPLALGFLLTQRHAFNFIINENKELVILNTQSAGKESCSDISQFQSFLKYSESRNSVELVYI